MYLGGNKILRVYYDLHIHSCLSACASDDMTPNNIVNMAKLSGIDVIAVTDHNSCLNCRAVVNAGKKIGILVVPGMELCTSEEIHVICLFKEVSYAEKFSEYVYTKIDDIKNDAKIFGNQIIMDLDDRYISCEERLLLNATKISINEVLAIVKEYNGTAFLPHVDRNSFSIISSLGGIPRDLKFSTAEVTNNVNIDYFKSLYPELMDMNIIRNSDSHSLESIAENRNFLLLDNLSIDSVFRYIDNIY